MTTPTPTEQQRRWLTQKLRKRFEVSWIDPYLLRIDPAYQRTFREPWGAEIVEKFDEDQVRPLDVVCRADGSFYVTNGQHTLYALVEKKWKLVPCFVRNGPTVVTDEAEHFIQAQTNSKSLRPLEMFNAAITAQRPMALDILAIVESFDLRIAHGVKNGIAAVKALERTYRMSGPDGLRDVLAIISAAWDEDDPRRFNAHTINGLALFLRWNPEANKERLIARLRTVVPDTLHARGRSIMQGAGSNSMAPALATAIDKIYRKRKIEDAIS